MSRKLTFVEKLSTDSESLAQTLALVDDFVEQTAVPEQQPIWITSSGEVVVSTLQLKPEGNRNDKPSKKLPLARFAVIAQIEGQMTIRSGTHKQRRHEAIMLQPWEVAVLAGPGKRSFENPSSKVTSESLIFEVTPVAGEATSFDNLYLSPLERHLQDYEAVMGHMAQIAIQYQRMQDLTLEMRKRA